MDRRIKFRHIEAFVEIAKERSLKNAAEKLFLTQPAISKNLKELEEILGKRLMERSRAGVSLTNEGELFLRFAQRSVSSLHQGYNRLTRDAGYGDETLRVGVLPSVAASIMPKVATQFATLAPGAMLQILDGQHRYLVERLRLGEVDMVIGRLGDPDMMQGLTFTQLYTERVIFVVRAGHPILEDPELSAIANYPLIFPTEGAAITPLVKRYLAANNLTELPTVIETVSGAFGRNYTRSSDAVWIISEGVVANELEDGRLVRLPFDTSETDGPVGILTRADAPFTDIMQVFRVSISQAGQPFKDDSHKASQNNTAKIQP